MKDKDFLWLNLRELPYFRAMLRAVEAQFYQRFELPSPTLDVGCGDGQFAKVTFDRKIDVGLDPWAGPIHQAATTRAYRSLVLADGGNMPFPTGYFASAFSNSVLEHVSHVKSVLLELGRVLRPGAPFLFCVPNPRYQSELSVPAILGKIGLKGMGQAYSSWFMRMSRTQHAVMPEVWEKWLQTAGFTLEDWWHYFSPEALHMLEWGHYFGAPTLLPHVLCKRWIIAPWRWNLALTERLVRRHVIAKPDPLGTYTFFVARRA